MTHNLKAAGLSVAAVFAFSALAASGAMAQEGKLTSANGLPFTLTATEVPGGVNAITTPFGIIVKCPGSTYTGHKVITTPHTFVLNGAMAVTITPNYMNCEQEGKARTIDMNGCDYVWRDATTTVGGGGTYGITVDIVCPVGKKIVGTGAPCTIEVGPQTGLTGLHATNEAGDLRVKGSVALAVTKCGFNTTGTQHFDLTVKAHDEAKGAINISISD